jgi:hypothetical protein
LRFPNKILFLLLVSPNRATFSIDLTSILSRTAEIKNFLFFMKDMLDVTSLTPRPKEAKFPNKSTGTKSRFFCSAGNNIMSSGM